MFRGKIGDAMSPWMSVPQANARFRRAAQLCIWLVVAVFVSVGVNLYLTMRLIQSRVSKMDAALARQMSMLR